MPREEVDSYIEDGEESIKKEKKKKSKKTKTDAEQAFANESERDACTSVVEELDEKRESLAILATLDQTKDYIGKRLCLADVHKLSVKDVDKYFKLYQCKLGREACDSLMKGGLTLLSKLLTKFADIDDVDAIVNDILEDKIVKKEIGNSIGFVAVHGGRSIALLSGLIHIVQHSTKLSAVLPTKSGANVDTEGEEKDKVV